MQAPKQGNGGSSEKAVPSDKGECIPTAKVSPCYTFRDKLFTSSIYLISELSVVLRLVSSPSTNWHRGRNRLTTERTHLAIRDTSRLFQSMTIAGCVCMCDVMILIVCVYRWQRKRSDPMTPDKNNVCSTRAWQGQVKVWRRALHTYDPPNEEGSTQFTSKDAALCGL